MNKTRLIAVAMLLAAASNYGNVFAQDQRLNVSLQELYQMAERQNTSIKSFQSAVSEAEAGIKSAEAERLPDLDASLSFSYLGNGRIWDRNFKNGFGVDIPHYGNNFALKAQWAVYTGGAISSGISLAKMNAEMARLNATDNTQRVRFLLTGYYLQLHNLKNQEQVFDENIALTETLIAHTEKRQQEGVVLRNDITRYELQLESLRLGRTQVQNQMRIINHQLLTALGQAEVCTKGGETAAASASYADEPMVVTTADTTLFSTPLGQLTFQYWQNEATQSATPLQKSSLAIQMSEQKERLQKASLRPSVAIVAEEHLDGPITIDIPNLNNNFNYWFVGVGARYSFGSLWKDKKRVKQAQLATQHARDEHAVLTETIDNAVQAAYTQYLTSLTTLETNQKSVELAQQNYEVVSNRYSNGLALVTDMIDAANQRLDAQLDLVGSRIDVLYNFYNLRYITSTL